VLEVFQVALGAKCFSVEAKTLVVSNKGPQLSPSLLHQTCVPLACELAFALPCAERAAIVVNESYVRDTARDKLAPIS
jgi:hypothetical protein